MTAFSCAMLLNRPFIVLKSFHCSIKLFMIGVF
ncbi:hypothetical protein L935_04030 [Helicobacter pylori PZ5086]|nr:hypothetical protein N203_00080 [Helicobacter pylori UM084]EQD92836.1 hypothetical protein L935_04030 [Helicobacter pylori PZ5086]EQL66333.1 hypothetical protein N408_00835 [Helicobacter pylori FD703]